MDIGLINRDQQTPNNLTPKGFTQHHPKARWNPSTDPAKKLGWETRCLLWDIYIYIQFQVICLNFGGFGGRIPWPWDTKKRDKPEETTETETVAMSRQQTPDVWVFELEFKKTAKNQTSKIKDFIFTHFEALNYYPAKPITLKVFLVETTNLPALVLKIPLQEALDP